MSKLHELREAPIRWQNLAELEALLPSRVKIGSANGVHRFGFSHLLAERCGLRRPRRVFANWVHGWIWDDRPTAESLHVGKQLRDIPVVVRNEVEKAALEFEGFRRVVVGGLPFAYVSPQHNARNRNALLAIPPHSAEVERLSSRQSDYMDYLESLKGDYDGIYVSIFYLDWNGPMHQAAAARGLRVVQGARPDDANSLRRVRALFEAFEQVTSNTMGSHFVYALQAGSRFAFSGPIFAYDAQMFLGNGNPHSHSEARVNRLLEIQDPQYLRRRFGRFFCDHPRQGVADRELGASEVGVNHLLEPESIREILGWTLEGQIKGYSLGVLRRMRRLAGLP